MISLTDRQLSILQQAAAPIPIEKRSIFLQRIFSMLNLRKKFSDDDVADVAALARFGLVHRETTAA
jgi:hypothetical protein